MFTSSAKREIRHFHVVVVQRRQRSGHKRRDAVVVCQSKAVCFFAVLVPVADVVA